jgi:Ni,Fe-hydrogenase I cytochrome b subunit
MAALVLFNFLYFMGSAFFVKSVFRERTNKRWIAYARIYHTAAPFIPLVIGFPYMAAAFVFSSVRAFVFAGKQIRPMKVGIIEIVGSVLFVLLSVIMIQS